MSMSKRRISLIGRREFVDFPELNIFGIEAKVDTGAYTSSIHCGEIYLRTIGDQQLLCFNLLDESHPEYSQKLYEFENFSRKKIKNSFGEMEKRYVIKTVICI